MAPSWYENKDSSMEGSVCRGCGEACSLWTDWSAGDVVCRECGVVSESHVRFEGPEWREFAADKADGLGPTGGVARACIDGSGDGGETIWRFGSGSGSGSGSAKQIQLLMKIQRKTQKSLLKLQQQQSLEDQLAAAAEASHTLTSSSAIHTDLSTIDNHHHPPPVAAAVAAAAATVSSKWSVSRALAVFGKDSSLTEEEQSQLYSKAELKCAKQLHDAMTLLEQYLLQLQLLHSSHGSHQHHLYRHMLQVFTRYLHQTDVFPNQTKLPPLLASIIYKSCGQRRTLLQICTQINTHAHAHTHLPIRPKHCTPYLKRLQPFYDRQQSNSEANDHHQQQSTHFDNNANIIDSLNIPLSQTQIQVISTCVTQLQAWQRQYGIGTGISPMNIVASAIYFIGHVASIYKTLLLHNHTPTKTDSSTTTPAPAPAPAAVSANTHTTTPPTSNTCPNKTEKINNNGNTKKRKRKEAFDVMTDDAIPMDTPSSSTNNIIMPELENNIVWWKKESCWYRSVTEIEKTCQISQRKILSYIKTSILPHKEELLNTIEQQYTSLFTSSFVSTMSPLLTWNRLTLKS